MTPDTEPTERAKLVDVIARNAREMATTIENIPEVTQLETDSRQHRHVSLLAAVREETRQVREAARFAGVTNYLSNAIKYSNRTHASAFAEINTAVEIAESGEREIVIRVTDNGIGTPPEKRERLYERFYRAHGEIDTIEGTGLGLSIVRDAAETHGGRTWAEFPGTGSTFVLALPLRREADSETKKGAE